VHPAGCQVSQIARLPRPRPAALRPAQREVRGNLEIWNPENLPHCTPGPAPLRPPGRAAREGPECSRVARCGAVAGRAWVPPWGAAACRLGREESAFAVGSAGRWWRCARVGAARVSERRRTLQPIERHWANHHSIQEAALNVATQGDVLGRAKQGRRWRPAQDRGTSHRQGTSDVQPHGPRPGRARGISRPFLISASKPSIRLQSEPKGSPATQDRGGRRLSRAGNTAPKRRMLGVKLTAPA